MRKNISKLCDKDITKVEQSTSLSCPQCGATSQKLGIGKGPHSASLRCAVCDRFIKWVGKTELARIQAAKGVQ